MGNEQTYEFEAGPYCRCCGSRDVMTLDVFIEESNDWEYESFSRLPHTHAYSIASMAFFSVWDGEVAS